MKNILLRLFTLLLLFAFVLTTFAQIIQEPYPTKRPESAETWKRDGWNAIDQAKNQKIRKGKAKNVILFIGDGMGISTLTASRIFEGQQRGESGEENRLSFEQFPFSALSKTYSVNQQTSDSAPTMSAIITGVKTDEGVLSVDQNVVHADYKTVSGNETKTLLEMAEDAGKSTGVITTTRLTHATPGACYAHTADRDWESDGDMRRLSEKAAKDKLPEMARRHKAALDAKFPDIASQLLNFKHGDGLEVALGGGRGKFLPKESVDKPGREGERLDGQDLTKKWTEKYQNSAYVADKDQLAAVDPRKTKHLLGLFSRSSMEFDYDRISKKLNEPSLTEMTTKAIDVVSQNKKGFFLMVEAGRIDQAHHLGNAYRALQDTVELSNAVRAAVGKVNLDETLIIVTADHSHTLTMMGYPARGNNILGLVREIGPDGELEAGYNKDKLDRPYTTLNYTNGRGYTGSGDGKPEGTKVYPDAPKDFKGITNGRPDLGKVDPTSPNYMQEATIPLDDETHGGEDVAIFATGVNAHLIRGSMEENWIFYVMADALRLGRK